jgi:hypothetical protein
MADFKGKNSIKSAARLAFERAKYQTEAFPENDGLGPEQVVDFNFVERTYYGRVDRQLNAVEAISDFVMPIFSTNNRTNEVSAMNFVVDAFNDFEQHFVKACKLGLIDNEDPYLSNISLVKGYTPPRTDYNSYIDEVISTFSQGHLPKVKNRINSFNDYLHELVLFVDRMRDMFPLTYSNFMKSNNSSIFHSGLALDIAGLPYDNDEVKQVNFLESPSFQYYLNLAKQYGFSINKRVPFVMVADLQNPTMKLYREKYGLSNINLIFSKQYTRTIFQDIDILRQLLLQDYNFFVLVNNLKRKNIICGNNIKSEVIKRTTMNNINNNILYKIYIRVRNIEERKPYRTDELKLITDTAIRLLKIDETSAISYIDSQFRARYLEKDGTFSELIKKQQKDLDRMS